MLQDWSGNAEAPTEQMIAKPGIGKIAIAELGCLFIAMLLLLTACSRGAEEDSDLPSSPPEEGLFPSLTLDPDNPVVVGPGSNSFRPSGEGGVGIDGSDEFCEQLRRDLDDAVDRMFDTLEDVGTLPEYLPSRSELRDQVRETLEAYGCEGS